MPSSADYVDNAPPAFCSTAVPQRDAEATGKGVGGERSVADLQGSSEGETYAEGNGPEHAAHISPPAAPPRPFDGLRLAASCLPVHLGIRYDGGAGPSVCIRGYETSYI